MKRSFLLYIVLFMASSAYAECSMYIDDIELKRSELGTQIVVPVKAHFSARVSAWQVSLSYPEGLSVVFARAGNDMTIEYYNSNGEKDYYNAQFFYNNQHMIGLSAVAGYWQDPNGEDPNAWVSYGTIKWEAGDYDEMFLLYLMPSVEFNGGDINITFDPASGADTRGGTVKDTGDTGPFYSSCHVTVIDDELEQTAPPTISLYSTDNGYIVSLASDEPSDIYYRLRVNYNEYGSWILYTEELLFTDQGRYRLEAYAKAIGKSASDIVVYEFVCPGLVKTKPPVISYSLTDDAVIVTATGDGDVLLYANGEQVDNPCFLPRLDEDYVVIFSATAKEEGKLISDVTYFEFTIPPKINVLLGDVNIDGTVNILDLNEMLNIIFYDGAFVVEADMNKDMIINVQDVVGLVSYLLNGEIPSIPTNGLKAPRAESTAQARMYWQDGVLYLDTEAPISAFRIINDADGDITWNLDSYGMVVMQSPSADGEHAVIFSFDRSTIPPGVTAIATTNSQAPSVVGAELSTLDSNLIPVTLNDQITGLTSIQAAGEINCYMDGSNLVIDNNAILHDLDITAYTIDGRDVANQHLSLLDSGRTSIEMNDIIKSNRYLIVVVRNGRQILATLKLTQNR